MITTTSALHELERRVEQLLDRHESLRRENLSLRQQLLESQSERDELRRRVELAAERLEALRATLPADA